jgi:peptide/nickel transport system substrate-binding protein
VTFHGGRDMTSADVVFTLDRARGPQSTNANKRFFEPITAVEATGPLTVRVTLSRPVGSFLYDMGSADAAIISEATAANNTTNPIGTGPFRFVRRVRGDRVELERFPQYWGEAPRMARVTFRFISDAQAQAAALRSGDVHEFPTLGAAKLLAELRRDPNFEVLPGLTEGEVILAMNHRRRPLNGLRLRRAITHALDRQAINEGAVGGYGRLIGTHYPPHYPDALDLTGMYPHDLNCARALLREAGAGSGSQARLILPPFPYARRAGEIIQAMLGEVGILTRVARAALLKTLAEPYVRTARTKGLSRAAVLFRHALGKAMLPVITVAGVQVSVMLAGSIIVENLFVLPGLGRLTFQAIQQNDLILIRNTVLLLAAAVMLVNMLVDLVCAAIDPRLRAR